MGNLSFHVVDAGNGKPIYNAEVIVNIENQPCHEFAIGCSSGDPYTDNDYTDQNGNVSFSLKYNTSASVQYQVMATGYDTQNGQMSISGANLVDENVWGSKTVSLVAASSPNTPPGQGALANVTSNPQLESILEDFGYSATNAGFFGSIELTIIVVFVAIAVIVGLIVMAVMA